MAARPSSPIKQLQSAIGDRYAIQREVARGGMATVYLATDTRHDRQVAVKVMDPSVVGGVGADRFLREIAIAARLTHPHIVPLYDSGELKPEPGNGDDGTGALYYVMPYISGESLRDRLDRTGPLPPAEVERVVREVASALDYAHRQGVVHRDIKPENVMLSEGHAVVADFGIARALLAESAATTITQIGMIVGTPTYMAPEQAGGEEIDGRADQYSLACVAYELLVGKPPFTGNTVMALLAQHLASAPPAVRTLEPIADTVEAAVHRALAKQPAHRFTTTSEFAEAFASSAQARSTGSFRLPSGAVPQRAPRLPEPITPLVGRETEVRTILALLQRDGVRLVTLHGPGGIGKTRLALEVASRAMPLFESGAYFVPLAEAEGADALVSRLTLALGMRGAVVGSSDALRDQLRERETLLVLDNFEQVAEDASAEISALLGDCPGLTILVTSQVLLRLYGEHEFPVDALPLPASHHSARAGTVAQSAAVQLFVERASAARQGFVLDDDNAAAVAGICAALDGVPLALELAAARVRTTTPQALLPRIRQSLDALGGGARDLPPRQRTMRAAIAWSHDGLPEEECILFRRLAVFEGGASAEAAASICADDEPIEAIEDRLASLADKSLLRPLTGMDGTPRYHMLRPVLAFAREALATAGELDRLSDAHAEVYADLARQAEPHVGKGDGAWLDHLEVEHDNLRAALDRLASTGHATDALRMALSLWRFWEARSLAREGLERLRTLLAATHVEHDPKLRMHALFAAGILADACGDYRVGRELFDEHLALTEQRGDARGATLARNNLAILLLRQGLADDAIPFFEQTVTALRETGDRSGVAMGLANIGNAECARRNYAAARERYAESLQLFREAHDEVNVAWALSHLGDVARDEGDATQAKARYREGIAAFQALGHWRGLAAVLVDLAELVAGEGELREARALLEDALTRVAEAGDQRGMLRVFEVMAGLATLGGADERALRLAGAVAGLRDALGAPLSDADRARIERRVLASVARIGQERSDAAWREGLAMAMEDVVRYVATPDPG